MDPLARWRVPDVGPGWWVEDGIAHLAASWGVDVYCAIRLRDPRNYAYTVPAPVPVCTGCVRVRLVARVVQLAERLA